MKRVKKQVINTDSISYLKSKFTHDQIVNMLQKEQEPNKYSVDYKKGKIIKKRQPKIRPEPITEEIISEPIVEQIEIKSE